MGHLGACQMQAQQQEDRWSLRLGQALGGAAPSVALLKCMEVLQVEGRKWRQRTYARDNGGSARRRDSRSSTNGPSSPAGASPADSAASIRLPKFARQMPGMTSGNVGHIATTVALFLGDSLPPICLPYRRKTT